LAQANDTPKLGIFYFGKHEMHGGIIVALVFH